MQKSDYDIYIYIYIYIYINEMKWNKKNKQIFLLQKLNWTKTIWNVIPFLTLIKYRQEIKLSYSLLFLLGKKGEEFLRGEEILYKIE